MRYLYMIILLLSVLRVSVCQDLLTIRGQIVESQTGIPVSYATIRMMNSSLGTASNAAGEFIIKIPATQSDSLVISSIGYVSKTVPVNTALSTIYQLEPSTTVLDEVIVEARSGLSFFKRVMEKIPENYDTSAIRLKAYYSENYFLGDRELAYNESVLEIFHLFHYDKKNNDQIRLVKGRKKDIDLGGDGQFLFWLSNISNTARSTLREDPVKYSGHKNSMFNPRNYKYYQFDYVRTIRDEDREIIVLEISPKENARKGYVFVRLYIDAASLAIMKVELETSERGIDYINKHEKGFGYTIMSVLVGAKFDFARIRVTIDYNEFAGLWYLNSIHRQWDALINSNKRDMVDSPWSADMRLLVTEVDTSQVEPFSGNDISQNSGSMGTIIDGSDDDTFWGDHNIIPHLDTTRADQTDSLMIKRDSNRQNGFHRGDSLRGGLNRWRSCYDVTYYHLDATLDIPHRSISGSNSILFSTLDDFDSIQVDLYKNMIIDSVIFRENSLSYSREFDAVFIRFPQTIRAGTNSEVKIYYHGVPKTPDWDIPMNGGMLWSEDSLANPWVQMVCQGSGASLWWPNKDHLSDEPDSMKIWITVPKEFSEISNGQLTGKTELENDQVRFEWTVSYPINNYNVTLNAGKYSYLTAEADSMKIGIHVLPYHESLGKDLLRQTTKMLRCFEHYFGPYPFPNDGFHLVESLYPMEHQNQICIGGLSAANSGNANPLLWHESAHEWWGNAVSCKDIADLWIHEAFATYAEALMVEWEFGLEESLSYIDSHREAIKNNEPIIGEYGVNHIYYDIGDMYEKGMFVLNTFRFVLADDDQWFSLLKAIQNEFRYQTISSEELVDYICDYTGVNYHSFFEQYLRHSSIPVLEISLEEIGDNLDVRYRWVADVPDFSMPVEVTLSGQRQGLIYPGTEWKERTLKNMSAAMFEVNERKFLIDVQYLENN